MNEVSPLIAVDRDDVLVSFVPACHDFHNERYGTQATYEGSHIYNFSILWNCPPDQAMQRVLEFYQSDSYRNLVPMEGSQEGVDHLRNMGFRLAVITSTHESALTVLEQSLDKHFPGRFEGIHLTHAHGGSGSRRTKPEICQAIGAKFLLDDFHGNFVGCRVRGVQPILMRHPWNRGVPNEELEAEGVLSAENWPEAIAHIEQTSKKKLVNS